MKFITLLPLAAVAAMMLPSSAMAATNTTLSILSNNVYFLSEALFPNWGQRARAQLIADSNYIKGHDVVVIQECFDLDPCGILKAGLKTQYPHQTDIMGQSKSGWDSTSGSYSSTTIENGGVVIMSKWPIKQKHQFVFKGACGADWFANKGFAYVVLDYKGTNLHVFGTHMQSEDSGCTSGQAAVHRASALAAWRSYIDSRNIPANELVIMAGDFNIKRDTSEFNSSLIKFAAVQAKVYDGFPWTWDPLSNQIAGYNYPGMASEYLDYVFVDQKHGLGLKSFTQTALEVHSPAYVLKGVTYKEYSDHYPVRAIIDIQS